MMKARHNGRRKASALGKTGAERSAHVMKPEYLAEIEHFRLMDDIEIQRAKDGAEPKRARYNSALMDANGNVF